MVGDLGEARSFHITKLFLVFLTACSIVILASVIYSLISYKLVRFENTRLKDDLDKLGTELGIANKAKEKALVSLIVLEGGAKETEKKAVPVSDSNSKKVALKAAEPDTAVTESSKAKIPDKPKPAAVVSPSARAENGIIEQPVSSTRIRVQDLEIWKEPESNTFKFQFILKSIDREGREIAGRTFVVLKPEQGSRVSPRTFPWTRLKDGRPATYKKGQYFSIARFKYVRGRLTDIDAISRFKTATVYVYSVTGELLVEQVLDVSKILRS